MQDGIEVAIQSSITTGREQKMYVSRHDVELMQGKKVGIIDDVVSSGNSLVGLEKLVELSGGTVCKSVCACGRQSCRTRRHKLSRRNSFTLII